MASQWWSWALAGIGIAGLWLAGSHRAVGWAVGVAVQGLWVAYAIATRQWGFIASALAYAVVYGRNWRRWTREHRHGRDAAVFQRPPIMLRPTRPAPRWRP